MKRFFAALMMSVALVGCASKPSNVEYGQIAVKEGISGVTNSTFVQWNDEYAVTVKHGASVPRSVYISDEFDVQFIKKESIAKVKWNSPKDKEVLSMEGFTKYRQKTPDVMVGPDAGITATYFSEKDGYRLVETTIQKGMSGGPVYNSNREVVGINIGFTAKQIKVVDKTAFYSVYLPYDTIKAEWEKFKTTQQLSQK